uniref:Uncharacterized protein LOC101500847 n=1 Tax=Cicer arietinum TaxID=3827 RepID=A0A1S3DY21_CICAR|nr:uncharacterized protein LOC101500847 [Cicer arietinum]
MEEFKLSDPIKLSEKRNEDQVILQMEEFKSSDPIKPRSIESEKVILSDEDRYLIVATTSMILCSILIIFPTLKMSGVKFMEEHDIVITLFLSLLVIFFQFLIGATTIDRPANDNIFSILFILLLSSATSIMEVSLVSHSTCIAILVSWLFLIAIVVRVNWQKIANVVRVNWKNISSYNILDILVSQGMKKFIPTICVLSLVCDIIFLVHIFSS